MLERRIVEFPSPYGVSFILIENLTVLLLALVVLVSVSLRSIVHSYLQKGMTQ